MIISVVSAGSGATQVTVDLQGTNYVPGTVLTVTRQDPLSGEIATVYSGEYVSPISDLTPPLGRNLVYKATMGANSASATFMLPDTLPIVSNEDGSSPVPVTIYEWPELGYETQTITQFIPGRPDPVVIIGPEQLPSSTVTFVTLTSADLAAFRALTATGGVLLVRAPCGAVETAFLSISDRKEQRITKKGSDWRRLHVCQVQHVSAGLFPSEGLFPSASLYPSQSSVVGSR